MIRAHNPLQVQLNTFIANRLAQMKTHGLVGEFFDTENTRRQNNRGAPNCEVVMMTPAAFNSKMGSSSSVLSNAFVLAMADFAQRIFQMVGSESSLTREFASHIQHHSGHNQRRIEMVTHKPMYPSFNITYDMITIALASVGIDMGDVRVLNTFFKSGSNSAESFYAYKMMQDTARLANLAGRDAHIPVPAMLLEALNRKGPAAHLYQAAVRLANTPVLSDEANAFAKNANGAQSTTPDMEDDAFKQELMRRISTPEGIAELNRMLEGNCCQIAHAEMSERELRTSFGYISYSLNKLAKQAPEKMEGVVQAISNRLGGYIPTQMSVDKIFEYMKTITDGERAKIFERMIQMFMRR